MKSIPSNGTLRHLLLLIVLLLNSVWEWKNVDNKIATAFVVGNKLIKPNAMYRWRNYGIHAGKSFNDVDIGDRVVVTGMGVISPCGNEVEAFFRWISHSGKSSVTRLNRFDTEPFKCKIAAQVENFYPKDYYIVKKRAKENDLSCHYAVAASHMALQMAGISIGGPAVDWNRVGVSIGSGFGGIGAYANALESMTEKGINGVSPYTIPMILGNFPAAMVSIEVGARGPSKAVQTACATATDAIGDALQLLRNGKADVMIAGGTEAPLTPLIFAGFQNLRTLSTSYNDEPNIASRPFDLKRDGFVMSEGAGVLVLERLTHAVRRNAKVYCELAGFGFSSDAYHITSPEPTGDGMARAMTDCIRNAQARKEEVQYINAHGTSTQKNDFHETLSIKLAFGDEYSRQLKVSSIKGCTGHALGATGGFEAISCVKSLETGVLPPTINQYTQDPGCDLDYIPNEAVTRPDLNFILSCSSGFGGHNSVLGFRKCMV